MKSLRSSFGIFELFVLVSLSLVLVPGSNGEDDVEKAENECWTYWCAQGGEIPFSDDKDEFCAKVCPSGYSVGKAVKAIAQNIKIPKQNNIVVATVISCFFGKGDMSSAIWFSYGKSPIGRYMELKQDPSEFQIPDPDSIQQYAFFQAARFTS